MAKIISKYSQAKNLQVEYTNQQEYMDAVAAQQNPKIAGDVTTPYTFLEWYKRNVGIIPGEEFKQYNEYLKNWYSNRYTPANTVTSVRADYISLLQQLALILKDEDDTAWMADINYNDNLELEDAIPFFARKLKEIAIYIVNKREALKRAKLKYNMVGTSNALEKLFYEYLLKAFTQKDFVVNVPEQEMWATFPELSAVKNGFQINIQELYDDSSYFDKDPTMPASAYFDTTDLTLSAYYVNTLTYQESAINWLFSTGFANLCADNPLIWTLSDMLNEYDVTTTTQLPLSVFEMPDKKTLNVYDQFKLPEKYLGENQYFLSGGYFTLKTKDFVYDLQAGNTWFYWPSGEYFREIPEEIYDRISLSSTALIDNGATGGLTYQDSDRIFVQMGNAISGAWLRSSLLSTILQTMSAVIPNRQHLVFRFPYPGYGISGEGLDWTGKQLSNIDTTFVYLDDTTQKEILDLYWSNVTPVSTFSDISIHNTALIDNGSTASQTYKDADKISVRECANDDKLHDLNPNSVYSDGFDYTWLYKILNTDLPIKTNQNYIYWPLLTYQLGETFPLQIPTSQCIPISLSSINVENTMIGARAGYGLYDSDIIYKLDSATGYALACSFLSGVDLNTLVPNASGKIQPSFTLKCKPGAYEQFVWQDSNTQINNTTITHKNHQLDCPYIQAEHESIFNSSGKTLEELGRTNTGMSNYKLCNCKAIWYSPLGHPGSRYDEYDEMADIIFTDTQFPSAFDINTWRGRDNQPYYQSQDFAWFQLTGTNLEPDVGWGNGMWTTGAGTSTFTLSTGVIYKYLRANLRRAPGELFVGAVPNLIIKQQHYNTPKTTWMKAALQSDGSWGKTNDVSDMVLTPGDYLLYDHMDSNWYCLTSIGTYGQSYAYTASAVGTTPWSNYTYVTSGHVLKFNWPSTFYIDGPSAVRAQFQAITWYAQTPSGIYTANNISPDTMFTILAETPGIYTITAVAIDVNSGSYTYTDVPAVTVVNEELGMSPSGFLDITTIYNDRLNFIINIPLSGWNYGTHCYDGISYGGRPFWAKAYDDDSSDTKQKGTNVFGGGIKSNIDDYTLITQPTIATIQLSSDCVIDYNNVSNDDITWIQPINFTTNINNRQWNKLIINTNVISPLSTYLFNINEELIASATNESSDIVLYQHPDSTFINYWAVNPFTWTQNLTDSTVGIPPTGGLWTPVTTGVLVETIVPYANLTNRHYPTIASMPYLTNLYSTEDSGGYFIPRMLGISTYIGSNYENVIDLSKLTTSDNRGLSGTFQDIANYTSSRGLTQRTQVNPVSTNSIDSSWTKANLTEGNKAGMVVKNTEYQEFIPYQTKYESTGRNFNGLRTQNDSYDPWIGTIDNIWEDPTNFPANFRNEYPIEAWYNNQLPTDKLIYQWKTDIFGNQYVLLKDNNNRIYTKRSATGQIWVRDQNGKTSTASMALSNVYDNLTVISPQVSADLTNNKISNFELWFDTLMIQTTGYLLFSKLEFDYDTNTIYSIADNVNIINLSADSGGYFAGTWLFDESKLVTICNLVSTATSIYPELYVLNLDSNNLRKEYSPFTSMQNQMSALRLTAIEDPVFTYNNSTKNYKLAFIGYGSGYGTGMVVNVMTINGSIPGYDISVTSIIPT